MCYRCEFKVRCNNILIKDGVVLNLNVFNILILKDVFRKFLCLYSVIYNHLPKSNYGIMCEGMEQLASFKDSK